MSDASKIFDAVDRLKEFKQGGDQVVWDAISELTAHAKTMQREDGAIDVARDALQNLIDEFDERSKKLEKILDDAAGAKA